MKKKFYNPSGEMPVYGNTCSHSQNSLPIHGFNAVLSMPSSNAASGKRAQRLPICTEIQSVLNPFKQIIFLIYIH